MVSALKGGDNTALAALVNYQDQCISMLVHKSRGTCNSDDAYDIFVDSIVDFRKNVLNDKVSYGSINAYLKRMCWNKWLAKSRKVKSERQKSDIVKSEIYTNNSESSSKEIDFKKRKQIKLIEQALQSISSKCRRILELFIIEECSMREIANKMDFANSNVAKTTKSRCYRKLITLIKSEANT